MHIEHNVSLHDKNWFGTGGNARFFCEPTVEDEFVQALYYAQEHNLDIFVLGQGANILVSDDGFDGLVIRPKLKQIYFHPDDVHVTVGSGVEIQNLIDTCLDHQMLSLEEFSGIPGTIGGAVYINIHYFQFLLNQFLVAGRIVERLTGQVYDVNPEWFNFGYNQSTLHAKNHYLLHATFALKKGTLLTAAYAKGRSDEIIRHRMQRYPRSNTCGSFFRNFHMDELPFAINDKKIPFVAYYLDKIGIKGALHSGNASVSHQHANMIVTKENARSDDVISVARTMQKRVYEEFGIMPRSECQFIGFKSDPL